MSFPQFSKWEGLGNDFIVVDARESAPEDPSQIALSVCDRNFGAGADGLVLLTSGNGADLGMDIYNSDGSRATMCGNAIRCLAALAHREGLVSASSGQITFSTEAGLRTTRLLGVSPWWVEVEMGRPQGLEPLTGKLVSGSPCTPTEIQLEQDTYQASLLSFGNPHCVLHCDRLPENWQEIGKRLEVEALPQGGRVNVGLAVVEDEKNLTLRVWERGAGPTLACGTAACAAMVATAHAGRCERRVTIHLPGGNLEIEWSPDNQVLMRGPARELFRGEWRPDPH